MYIIDVFIDRNNYRLDRTFSYEVSKDEYEKLLFGSSVFVLFNNQKMFGFVIKKHQKEAVDFKINSILNIIDINTLDEVQLKMYEYINSNFISSFSSTLRLILPNMVRKTLQKSDSVNDVVVRKILAYELMGSSNGLTDKQKVCYDIVKSKKVITKIKLEKEYNVTTSIINKLLDLKVIKKIYIDHDYLYKHNLDDKKEIILTNDQVNAVDRIKNSKKDVLLHGVTGSGKTEVFIELIKEVINSGSQVLFLVPEISLTVAITSRLETIFGDELIFIHSKLTQKEYYDYYLKIKDGSAKVIVGTRSSIFMPFKDLKLIIVDEEHDSSYKHNSEPFYHVKDMIKFWKKCYNTKIVYATATPSLESYVRCEKGVYDLVELKHRFNQNPLANIILEKITDYEQILTYNSLKAIKDKLDIDEKVVILYNKKGYAASMECNVCNHIEMCPCCSIPLTYYQKINALKCNVCGHYEYFKNKCSSCNTIDSYKYNGIGIEKVCDYLDTMFGSENIIQIDSDIVSKKNKLKQIMTDFKKPGRKILLGTQIISKGLDFMDVNLVVVINVDNALYFNDIRAHEKVFQLLVQTAGRAGRHSDNASVIIQTKHVDNKLFKYVCDYDYLSFYKNEIQNRMLTKSSPFFNVAQVETRHLNQKVAHNYLNNLKTELTNQNIYTSEINVPYITTFDNKKRKVMIIKYKDLNIIKILNYFKDKSVSQGVEVIIDLNIN